MNNEQKLLARAAVEDWQPTEHGTHNERKIPENYGYIQATSGLCEMTDRYKFMLEAEARFWQESKLKHPEQWQVQLRRLRHTRGTIFVSRLLERIRRIERKRLL